MDLRIFLDSEYNDNIHYCLMSLDTTAIIRRHNILVKAFNTYVRPVLEYASSIWSPTQIGLINRLESVQRRFTKRLPGIGHLTYRERLSALYILLCCLQINEKILDCLQYK